MRICRWREGATPEAALRRTTGFIDSMSIRAAADRRSLQRRGAFPRDRRHDQETVR
jgi:hypothetical protein